MSVYTYLSNVQIAIIGEAEPDVAKRIRDEVRTGGGVFDTQLTKETTHAILVTGNDPNQKNVKEQISAAVNHGAVVLLRKWLQVCSIHKQLVPVQPFSIAPGSKLFSGLKFTGSKMPISDKVKLAALVTYHGGEYTRALVPGCTHLVTHRPEGDKYHKRDSVKGLTTVTPGWVLTSAKKRQLANASDFNPANIINEETTMVVQNQSIEQIEQKKKKPTRKKQVSLKSPVKTESSASSRKRKKVQLQMATTMTPTTTVVSSTPVMVTTTSMANQGGKVLQAPQGQTLLAVTTPQKEAQFRPSIQMINGAVVSQANQVLAPIMNTMQPGQHQIQVQQRQAVQVQQQTAKQMPNEFQNGQVQIQGHVLMNQPQHPHHLHQQQQQQQQRFLSSNGQPVPLPAQHKQPLHHHPQQQAPPPPPPQAQAQQQAAPQQAAPPPAKIKQLILPNSCPEEDVDPALLTSDKYPLYAESFSAPASLCMIGCIFYFDEHHIRRTLPFAKQSHESYERRVADWKRHVALLGALVEESYNAVTCTHVVATAFNSDCVQRALKDGVRVVTPSWIDWIAFRRKMSHPTNLLHVPLPCSTLQPLTGELQPASSKIRVSTSHFRPRTSVLVNTALAMFSKIQVTKMLYRDTDLILLPRPVGDKYTTATKFNKPALNLAWLRDMLLNREIDEQAWKRKEYRVRDNGATKALCLDEKCVFSQRILKPWLKPIKIEVDFEQRAKLRRVEETPTTSFTVSGEPSPKKSRILCYKPQPRVIFSGIGKDDEKELIRKLEMCGGKHVEQLGEATHLVTSGFKRSLKWYAALNVCGWVVTPDWINESFNSKWFLDEEHFQLKDAESENKYSFHIRESLKRANSHRIFAGLQFAILSNSIRPPRETLALIIRLGGGKLLGKMPPIKSLKQVKKLRDEDPLQCRPVIVLSSTEKSEHEHIRILREADINCYSPELVLSASLKQVIELGPHLIRENGKSY